MEIKNYIKNGYLVTNKILNEDQIISLREEINKEFIKMLWKYYEENLSI